MSFTKTTEQPSHYDSLESMPVSELLSNINREDQTVALAVQKCLPEIEALAHQVIAKLQDGGRLFYIGAGTSGRLGIVDASECPPTFGVPHDLVNGIIAGGDQAIRRAVENAEDDPNQARKDLQSHNISQKDVVIGIAASGTTPYVIGGLEACNREGIVTGHVTKAARWRSRQIIRWWRLWVLSS
jgi:N-acetylmuramic acid 6-phosphate etherase